MKVTIDKKNSGLEFIGWHELAIIFWYSGTSIDSPCHEEERGKCSLFLSEKEWKSEESQRCGEKCVKCLAGVQIDFSLVFRQLEATLN